MRDIFKYSTAVSRQNNRSSELAVLLPKIIGAKLENIAARRVSINGPVVTFHGRASRETPKPKRIVTNWNLLHLIVRGAVQVKHNFPEISVNYWLSFPASLLPQSAKMLLIMGTIAGIFYFIVQSSILLSLLLALAVAVGGFSFLCLLFALNFIITIVRFNLFIRYCVNVAEKQLQQ